MAWKEVPAGGPAACGPRAWRLLTAVMLPAAALLLGACSTPDGYERAFSEKTALAGNSHRYEAPPDQTFRTVKITLVQQGFTIEQADAAAGLIKAVRSLQDPKRAKFAYLITTTVDVSGPANGSSTIVTLSASQQTVLHKDSEKYYHLLGLVPIPTGKEYQTVVTKEGNIVTAQFYRDFFAAVERNLSPAESAPAPHAPALLPATPATPAPIAAPAPPPPQPAAVSPDAPAANPFAPASPPPGASPPPAAPPPPPPTATPPALPDSNPFSAAPAATSAQDGAR